MATSSNYPTFGKIRRGARRIVATKNHGFCHVFAMKCGVKSIDLHDTCCKVSSQSWRPSKSPWLPLRCPGPKNHGVGTGSEGFTMIHPHFWGIDVQKYILDPAVGGKPCFSCKYNQTAWDGSGIFNLMLDGWKVRELLTWVAHFTLEAWGTTEPTYCGIWRWVDFCKHSKKPKVQSWSTIAIFSQPQSLLRPLVGSLSFQ